jgi:predicted peptidase
MSFPHHHWTRLRRAQQNRARRAVVDGSRISSYVPLAMRALLFFVALSVAAGASAQTIHDEVLSQQDGPSIHYAISVPRDYHREPVPLILALHFGGDSRGAGHAMLQILIQPALGELGAVIVAPDSVDGRWSTPANERAVNALLAAVEKNYAIDQKKVIVTGFSMGGQGTWYWGDKYPDRFSAAVPLSGTPTASAATWRIPVFAVHSRDDQVQPIGPTEQRIAELKKNGVNAQIVVLSGIQHFETYKFVDGLRQAVPWIRTVWNKK